MNAIQRFKEWLKFEIEYTQTKVEYPHRSRVGKYVVISGGIIALLGILIIMVSPYKEVAYEGIRNERLPPFGDISFTMIIGGILMVVLSLLIFYKSEKFYNTKEV